MICTSIGLFIYFMVGLPVDNSPGVSNGDTIIQKFEKITGPDTSGLFVKKKLVQQPMVYIDFEHKKLVLLDEKKTEIQLVQKDSLFSISPDATDHFDDLIAEKFKLTEYKKWITDNKILENADINDLAAAFAISDPVLNPSESTPRDIAFSLLYKKLIGSKSLQQIAGDGKLESLSTGMSTVDVVNKTKLSRALTKVGSNETRDEEKFINAEYAKAHKLSSKSGSEGQGADTLFAGIFSFDSVPVALYLNESKHVLYTDNKAYSYDADSFMPTDSVAAAEFLKDQFSFHVQKNIDTRELDSKHGISYQNNSNGTTATTSGMFRSIILAIHYNQGPYFIISKRLVGPDQDNGDFLYGKFTEHEKYLNELMSELTSSPSMLMIKQSTVIYFVFFTILFLIIANVALQRFVKKLFPAWYSAGAAVPATQTGLTFTDANQTNTGTADGGDVDSENKNIVPKEEKGGDVETTESLESNQTLYVARQTEEFELKLEAAQKENLAKIHELENRLEKITRLVIIDDIEGLDVYECLSSEVREMEKNPDIPHLVKFAVLFRTPNSKEKYDSETILKPYMEARQSIDKLTADLKQKNQTIDDLNKQVEFVKKQLQNISELLYNADLSEGVDTFLRKEVQRIKKVDIPNLVRFASIFKLPSQPTPEATLKIYFDTEKLIRELSERVKVKISDPSLLRNGKSCPKKTTRFVADRQTKNAIA